MADAYPGKLDIIPGDALKIDATTLGSTPRRIVANLPYNVATELLFAWLENITAFESLTLMFQREVALRIAAEPGTKAYGRVSIMAQWLCEVALAFDVNPRAFTPPPKVDSSIITLHPRAAPLAPANRATLERVTMAAFGQRRKMLRQSLKSLGVDPIALCEATGIDPTLRAEALTVPQFCALANAVDAGVRSAL